MLIHDSGVQRLDRGPAQIFNKQVVCVGRLLESNDKDLRITVVYVIEHNGCD